MVRYWVAVNRRICGRLPERRYTIPRSASEVYPSSVKMM